MEIDKVLSVSVVFVGLILAGCGDKWATVESGEYTMLRSQMEGSQDIAPPVIDQLVIDRDKRAASFLLVGGSQISVSYESRDRTAWPVGCPSMAGTTHMEVLDIQESTLVIDAVTFTNPVLMAGCPPDSGRFFLGADSGKDGGAVVCGDPRMCLVFGPKRDRSWAVNDSSESNAAGTPVSIDIVASAVEPEGDSVPGAYMNPETFTIVSGPTNGNVINNFEVTTSITEDTSYDEAGAFTVSLLDLVTYTPAAGFSGTDSFTYQICDWEGYFCDTATVTVTVN